MRATVYHGPRDMRIDQVPDPRISAPTDVVARITHAGICGSDLWSYRGIDHREPGDRMGHEWMGMPALLQDVIAGKLDPSPVLDMTVDLDGVPAGYATMDKRSTIKVMVRP
ncbi:MAG: hypothetical protein E6I32_04635 [Chloroflexi bacterium]|nr:MAG: hypothetical protein E6I32_04635 [Chloroflexota bacterium]